MRNESLCKLYNHIDRDLTESLEGDLRYGWLTENRGRDGRNYFWYFDDCKDVAVEIETGVMVTDPDRIDALFA